MRKASEVIEKVQIIGEEMYWSRKLCRLPEPFFPEKLMNCAISTISQASTSTDIPIDFSNNDQSSDEEDKWLNESISQLRLGYEWQN